MNTTKSGSLLSQIDNPSKVSCLSYEECAKLAEEVRDLIIHTVSQNGGHLAPSLGVVELTIALLKEFDFNQDKIVWDVGHQAYAYKILTGRAERFSSLRTFKGLSGFPKLSESKYDHFGVGHSSTSISAALGFALARDLEGKKNHVVSVIGDGALTAGLAFEGLNQAGHLGKKLIVILNDNEMSIAKNVGALSLFLSRGLSRSWVRRMKHEVRAALNSIPGIGEDLVNFAIKSEHGLKSVFTPGMLFEALNFKYVGPVDGHNLHALSDVLKVAKDIDQPVLLHVLTKKGKGYKPAEIDPSRFHGIGKFTLEEKTHDDTLHKDDALGASGTIEKHSDTQVFEPLTIEKVQAKNVKSFEADIPSYTDVFARTLYALAEKDERIVAITAAMPEGTGLTAFSKAFPERFVDVGICEQHAVTFAAGLALEGLRPIVAIYSTFLQRAYDQVLHDVCQQNLPVVFCLDRAGLVGEDGPTHHGVFDLAYLRHIPNLTIIAPKDEAELQAAMVFALKAKTPVALRYPRGKGVGVSLYPEPYSLDSIPPLEFGIEKMQSFKVNLSSEVEKEKTSVAVFALGNMVYPSFEAAKLLKAEQNINVDVYNMRWVKPLPEKELFVLAEKYDKILMVEENVLAGGFSSAVLELLLDNNLLNNKKIKRLGIPDNYVEHGSCQCLRELLGLDVKGIKRNILELIA
ncbi:1-deoxy-D-xylulose-5-phosphate synthase [Desulfovibrio litoralis]|uniref:1-deoxy-D-xylulose-5-phosphate synthase n=1 Tax=Desulfovibrio litoralis TaxID=466107 RepID=UPI000934A953